ncbi:MAG: glutamyl-tRNA reductase [Aquificae bacterium]|nr:glutamyl-tRNA reductase [Aquificota bacterium]
MGEIFVTGVNFRVAPVEVREKLACSKDELLELLPKLKREVPVEELMLISTCNRVELYAYNLVPNARELALKFIKLKGLPESVERYFFYKRGEEAVFHVFKVASSLDSMVVGEPQIVAQFKEAYQLAREAGTVGKILNRLYEKALRASKRVRTETGISKSAVSVSYAAVELAKKIFGELKGAKVLLVGAGEMGELAASYLKRFGALLHVTNRTYERAVRLARELGADALRFEHMEDYLPLMDVVIVSTGAPHYVLTKEAMERSVKARNYEPQFVIDISVPRNADPEIGKLDSVFLYDIDDLKQVVEENLKGRKEEARKGEVILWDEVKKFLRWYESLRVEPHVLTLKEALKDRRSDPFLRRVLHRAIKELKANPDSADIILRIFGEEVKTHEPRREKLSDVYNRADGA